MTTIAERFKFLRGYPGAVKEEFMSGVQGLDEAIRSGGNTLLPSMQMRAAPMIPLIRGAAEQVAGPLAASINRQAEERNLSLDQLASQLGYDPETFPFVDTVRERGGVTEAQVASPLTFLLGTLRGKVWKSSLRGSVQKGPTTQQSKQWIADIKRDKGAWAEAKKTGLDKFLEANPKPSQAALISFLDQSGIELTETVKSGEGDSFIKNLSLGGVDYIRNGTPIQYDPYSLSRMAGRTRELPWDHKPAIPSVGLRLLLNL